MVSSILRPSFRYCFSACVTNSNIISLTPSLYITSHLSPPHPLTKLTSSDAPCLSRSSITSKLASMFWFSMSCSERHFSSPSYTGYIHNSRQLTHKRLDRDRVEKPIGESKSTNVRNLGNTHLKGFLHLSQGRGVTVPEVGGALGILEECMKLGTLGAHRCLQ